MAAIFITYRRADTAGWAGRIGDHLTTEFGPDSVFLDVDDIPIGVDFEQAIDSAAQTCSVMLTLIGRHWLAPAEGDDEPQIRAPDDHLRRELRLALRAGRPVIPVLVDGAKMPTASDLPRDLAGLSSVNAFDLSTTKFRHDVADLVGIIRPYVEGTAPPPSQPVTGRPTAAIPVVGDTEPPDDGDIGTAPDDIGSAPEDSDTTTTPDVDETTPAPDADDTTTAPDAGSEGAATTAPTDGDLGAPVDAPPRRVPRPSRRPPDRRPPPDGGRRRWSPGDQPVWLWIGAGAAVLIVVIAVVSALTSGGDGGGETTTSGPVTTTGTTADTTPTTEDGTALAVAPVDEIDLGGRPQHVMLRDGQAWVADSERGAVMVRDLAAGSTTEVPVSDGPVVHLVEAGGLVWVNAADDCAVVPIEPDTLGVGTPIPLGDGCSAGDMAVVGSHVWVAHPGTDELFAVDIDAATSTTVTVDGPVVSVASAHSSLWVTTEDGAVLRLDEDSGTETGRIDVGGQPLLMAATGAHLWVSQFQAGELAVIEPTDLGLAGRVEVRPGPLTLAGDGSTMWAVHFTDEAFLTAVDGETMSVVVEQPVPTQATGVSVAGDTVAVASFGARTLTLFEVDRG